MCRLDSSGSAQCSIHWRAFVKTVMNPGVLREPSEYLLSLQVELCSMQLVS
jgi:hypothetical protein